MGLSFVVLRPASLDARDTAIVRAVFKAWGCGRVPTYSQMEILTGISMANLHKRIIGGDSGDWHRVGLVERGWLLAQRGCYATLRPGPRFGGLGSKGTVYELAEARLDG